MKISESWLREWVNPEISTSQLAEQLTMAGLEVDTIESASLAFSKVVVAEVTEVDSHPDADKLRVCQVRVGSNENLQIVCGASNVRAGLRVPAALVGARLPGDLKIKKSKLRGEISQGMLCGASELGLTETNDGLMELPADAPVGTDIREYLNLDDQVIEVDLTPNRGDCLSIVGVAREVAVLNQIDLNPLSFEPVQEATKKTVPILVEAKEDCPYYMGRVIEGLDIHVQTPMWMQEKLNKSGLRSINPIVDVTNYVMMELGHPMHAFDLSKIDGGIIVRRAKDKEKLVLLDDKQVELSSAELVIADHSKALALAGIMGGLHSSVTDRTSDILLECAYFQPIIIAGKARHFGMQTDSSHRFERGVNPQQLELAMQRATQLLLAICGGIAGPIEQSQAPQYMPVNSRILLRKSQLDRILGMVLAEEQVEDILVRLGMDIVKTENGWEVMAPAFRFDIAIEADLIEELARIYGYNRLPTKAFEGEMHLQADSEFEIEQNDVFQRLFSRGYQEVITYSFVDPAIQSLLDPEAHAVTLANPISSDMSVMRTNLWSGLLQTISYNLKRQQERIKIFEYGLKFTSQDNDIKQINTLSGAVCGSVFGEQWGEKSRQLDFYDLKGDVESILEMTGMGEQFSFVVDHHLALHPGQTARIMNNAKALGWIGRVHPQVLQKLGVKTEVYIFELDWHSVSQVKLPEFKPQSKYPSVRRDLAIVVDEQVSSDQLISIIRGVIPEILIDSRIFDVYQGKGIDFGRKSVALGLILQDSSRTLTDKEVEEATSRVVAKLKKELGAILRD